MPQTSPLAVQCGLPCHLGLRQVRPRPKAEWLSDSSWARISELEDLGKGPWPGTSVESGTWLRLERLVSQLYVLMRFDVV